MLLRFLPIQKRAKVTKNKSNVKLAGQIIVVLLCCSPTDYNQPK